MPESYLWLANHLGAVFTLGTSHRKFKQLKNTWDDAVTVKRLSTSHWCAWAIGHDHRVYIYVLSSDVPIRVPETIYENQRWSPLHGFSKRSLIPTDRHAWSNESGTLYRPKESVRLPSAHWDWEGDWLIDDNLRGEVVGIEGWQYAFDFPRVFTPERHWNSFVRKRKWIRFRRFSSTDIWARISDVELVEKAQCFIDISVGGFLLPSQPAGFLSVWAVTNSGFVYVRTNVNHDNPEGNAWQEISIADHMGIINISVGASNLIWAITWDGGALVRTQVNRNNIYGSGWTAVEYPDKSVRLMQVSVGRNAVWAITREGKVWFRKGTSGDDMFGNDQSAVGTSWVEMVGEMSQIAVSCNDQVFAIDMIGKTVYFRTAVTRSDLTGKTWQPISLHEDLTALEREGFLSEGDVCSCGDLDKQCAMHGEMRQRLSSTATSSSSISTTTNNDDSSSDIFMSPLQPLVMPPAWQHSQYVLGGENADDRDSLLPTESPSSPDSMQLSSMSCPAVMNALVIPDEQEKLNLEKDISLPLQHSHSLHTLTPSTSQTSTLSRGSSSEDITAGRQAQVAIISSIVTEPVLEQAMVTVDIVNDSSQKYIGQSAQVTKQVLVENGEPSVLACDRDTGILTNDKIQSIALSDTRVTNNFANVCMAADSKMENKNSSSCSADSVDETGLARETPHLPQENIPSSSIQMVQAESGHILTELPEVDRHLLEQDSVVSSAQANQPKNTDEEKSLANFTADVSGNSLSVMQLVRQLHSSFPSSAMGVEENTGTCIEQTEDSWGSPSLVSESSMSIPVSVLDSDPTQSIHESVQQEKDKLLQEKKGRVLKKRKPKIIDFPDDVQKEDSIVFKPLKGKKKKPDRKVKTALETDKFPEIPCLDSGQPTAHQPQNTQQFANLSHVNVHTDTTSDVGTDQQMLYTELEDIDQVDAPQTKLHSSEICDQTRQDMYETRDNSSTQCTILDLHHSTEDFLSSTGYVTEAATSFYISPEVYQLHETSVSVMDMRNLHDGAQSQMPTGYSDQKQLLSSNNSTVNEDRYHIGPEHSSHLDDVADVQNPVHDVLCDKVQESLTHEEDASSIPNLRQPKETMVPSGLRVPEYSDGVSSKETSIESESFRGEIDETNGENVLSYSENVKEEIPTEYDLSAIQDGIASAENKSPSEQQKQQKVATFIDQRVNSVDSGSDEIIDFVTDLISDDEGPDGDGTNTKNKSAEKEVASPCLAVDRDTEDLHAASLVKSLSTSNLCSSSQDLEISDASHTDSHVAIHEHSVENELLHTHIPHVSSSQALSPPSKEVRPTSLPFAELQPARKLSRYRRSSSNSRTPTRPAPTQDCVPMFTMTEAQPRLCWRWLDVTSCVIDDPTKVEWLSDSYTESEPKKRAVKISRQLRDDIMKKIQDRNRREIQKFKDIEQAITRTTWVKKGSMHIFLYGRHNRWVPCNVELEQGITSVSDGCLTVHYEQKHKQKQTQLSLTEITCVKVCSDLEMPTGFTIYTSVTNIIHQPLMLRANSENESADWIGYLCAANATAWNLNRPISSGAIWSCTFTGDVFVSAVSGEAQRPFDLCWGQHGGHMSMVETGPSGVTWGLGFDKMPYVYNNGYGGAVNAGVSEMSDSTQQMTDYHRVYVFENQKWFPVIGWCCKGIFQNNFHWLTESGHSVASRDAVKLPSSKWQWISEWTVDFSTPGGVDTQGWQYSTALYGPFYPRQHLRSSYRRRRWIRRCKITLVGPWQTAGSLGLRDISIQIDPIMSNTDPVVMWAVGANGDVLCRNGVTATNPLGKSWIHVATDLDKPFKSVSMGGDYRVWGIASDGSAWYRPGVTLYNPAGKCWLQVVPPPPGNFLLHQISAGATSVWAVDTGDNLWRRQNITPTFPEGTDWEWVASRVKRVSVGPRDQVWVVTDAFFTKIKHGAGVIYSRIGISSSRPSGTDWEVVIGSGWAHCSIRGVSEVKLEDSVSKAEGEEESWD